MSDTNSKNTNQRVIAKSMKYSVITKFVNFDPNKFASKVIIVDGAPAIRIRKKIYTRLNKD
jgi:hypothetical protein